MGLIGKKFPSGKLFFNFYCCKRGAINYGSVKNSQALLILGTNVGSFCFYRLQSEVFSGSSFW